LDVYRGYPEYLEILADASLFNPSEITVIVSYFRILGIFLLSLTITSAQTNDVVFGLEFMDQIIGSVVIGDLLLIPDENVLGTSGTPLSLFLSHSAESLTHFFVGP